MNPVAAGLPSLPARDCFQDLRSSVRKHALKSLTSRDVQVIESARVAAVKDRKTELSNGDILDNDYVFMAVGVKPSSLFVDSGLPVGQDGGLLVNQFLQSVAYPELFGGGDCISFKPRPLAKVGVYAVRQNPILLHNLLNTLNGGALAGICPSRHFSPGPQHGRRHGGCALAFPDLGRPPGICLEKLYRPQVYESFSSLVKWLIG